jgi:hypothetical protein
MDDAQKELKTKVEDKLIQKITDLEAVKLALEEDVRGSTGEEQEKNQKLLDTTNLLLQQLHLARINLRALNPD